MNAWKKKRTAETRAPLQEFNTREERLAAAIAKIILPLLEKLNASLMDMRFDIETRAANRESRRVGLGFGGLGGQLGRGAAAADRVGAAADRVGAAADRPAAAPPGRIAEPLSRIKGRLDRIEDLLDRIEPRLNRVDDDRLSRIASELGRSEAAAFAPGSRRTLSAGPVRTCRDERTRASFVALMDRPTGRSRGRRPLSLPAYIRYERL